MSRHDGGTALLEKTTVARKQPKAGSQPKDDPPKQRERARDKGTVSPLGVEVSSDIVEAIEHCRAAKKWAKRTLVEEALRAYLAREGFPPGGAK